MRTRKEGKQKEKKANKDDETKQGNTQHETSHGSLLRPHSLFLRERTSMHFQQIFAVNFPVGWFSYSRFS